MKNSKVTEVENEMNLLREKVDEQQGEMIKLGKEKESLELMLKDEIIQLRKENKELHQVLAEYKAQTLEETDATDTAL